MFLKLYYILPKGNHFKNAKRNRVILNLKYQRDRKHFEKSNK